MIGQTLGYYRILEKLGGSQPQAVMETLTTCGTKNRSGQFDNNRWHLFYGTRRRGPTRFQITNSTPIEYVYSTSTDVTGRRRARYRDPNGS